MSEETEVEFLRRERDAALRMHQVQFERANRLEAQRDNVLNLCDGARAGYQPGTLAHQSPLLFVSDVREALGADDDR